MTDLNKKPKILYIITKSNWGGAQKHVFDLAEKINKDFDVKVAFGGSGPLKQKLEQLEIETFEIKNFQRDINLIKEIGAFFEIVKIIKKIKPEVIHLHSSKAIGIGSLAGKICGVKKIIATIHGWAFKEKRVWWQHWLIYLGSIISSLLVGRLIVVSKEDFDQTPKIFKNTKTVIINNGIGNFEIFERDYARKILLPHNEKRVFWIGTVAELHKNKALDKGIKAIAEIKKTNKEDLDKFIWVIISGGEEKENLQKMINDNNLEENIFLVGQKMDASKYLKAFDIFMLTSIKEGFPYSLLEAGYAGLPVIATDVGDAKELIQDMETGILIKPGDYKEIAYAIRHLIQNPDVIKKLGGAIENKVKKDFSLDKMIEKTILLYK